MSRSHVKISCQDLMSRSDVHFSVGFPVFPVKYFSIFGNLYLSLPFSVRFPVFAAKHFSKLEFCIYQCFSGLDFLMNFLIWFVNIYPLMDLKSNNNNDCLCITLWLILGMVLLISNAKVVTFFPHDVIEFWDNREFRSGVPGLLWSPPGWPMGSLCWSCWQFPKLTCDAWKKFLTLSEWIYIFIWLLQQKILVGSTYNEMISLTFTLRIAQVTLFPCLQASSSDKGTIISKCQVTRVKGKVSRMECCCPLPPIPNALSGAW